MKKIKIQKLHLASFIELIDSINKVDKFISLKIEPEQIKSSVHFPEKDAVKSISAPLEYYFDLKDSVDTPFKMCFFNGEVVNSILKRFSGPDVVSAQINVEEGDEYNYATSIVIFNSLLKIKISCSDPETGFTEIPDNILEKIFDTSDAEFEFTLDSTQKNKFEDLMKIDMDKVTFSITSKETGVYLAGESYEYQVSDRKPKVNTSRFLFKKFFNVLDKDDYMVKVTPEKTFFESQTRDVHIVFSNCED